jgi:hypothetical protein
VHSSAQQPHGPGGDHTVHVTCKSLGAWGTFISAQLLIFTRTISGAHYFGSESKFWDLTHKPEDMKLRARRQEFLPSVVGRKTMWRLWVVFAYFWW